MKQLQTVYLYILEQYLSVLSLPMVYRPRNHIIIYLIISMVIMSILFNSGLYLYLHHSLIY